METLILPADDPKALPAALDVLQSGGLVAFPTDTVYGLGGLAHNPAGIDELYRVKGREAAKAIPVLLGSLDDLPGLALDMEPAALRLAHHFWPGPLTLVVTRRPDLPPNLSTGPTIGLRMPDHPAALALLRLAGPMAVSSANLSGGANTTTAAEVLAQLGGSIPLILDGGLTPGGTPSTVLDCTLPAPRILRAGPVSLDQILAVLG